jgi:hypothetical protein
MRLGHLIGGLILVPVNVAVLLAVHGYGPLVINTHAVASLGLFNAEALLVLFSIAGVVSIVEGVRGGPQNTSSSGLKMDVLRHLSIGTRPDDITRITGMTKEEVDRQLVELRRQGHTTEENRLTEKGYDALRWKGRRTS